MTAWQERQDAEREEWPGKWPAHGLVFALQDGSALHPDYLSRAFRAHGKRAKLPQIRLHDLRHTHATLALQAGIHPRSSPSALGMPPSRSRSIPNRTRSRRCKRRRRH
ncbi:MAG TPA: hypothetical protein VIJ07_25005 [Dermatophilaceae bacterium]